MHKEGKVQKAKMRDESQKDEMNEVVRRLLEVRLPAVQCQRILLRQKFETTRGKIEIDLKIMWHRRNE